MGLLVWLPLKSNLDNLGLADVTVTNKGATYSSTDGKIGGCYNFDGSSQWIRISLPSAMTSILNTTVCAWVKSTGSPLALGGISHNSGNTTIGSCTLYSSGWQFSNNGSWGYVSGGTVVNTGVWHHVACTVGSETITTYLDGVKVATATVADKCAMTELNSNNYIEIGADHPGGDEYLTGSVNDFRVYDNCLTDLDIKRIYQEFDSNGGLQVWLPMTQDLRNQGLNGATITNSGAIFDNNGKLGKCCNVSSQIDCQYQGGIINTSSVSMGGWFKVIKTEAQNEMGSYAFTEVRTTPTGNLIGNNSYGGIGIIWSANNMYSSSGVLNTITVFPSIRTETNGAQTANGFDLSFGVWTHIFITFDYNTRELKMYKNGVLVSNKVMSSFSDAKNTNIYIGYNAVWGGNGPSFTLPMYVNDIRIYDYALSPLEVKKISQGLALHYTLSDNSIQSMNNCFEHPRFDTSGQNGGWSHWGASGHNGDYGQTTDSNYIFRSGQTYAHWVTDGSSATKDFLLYQSPDFEGGFRSLVVICKEENSTPITNSICYPAWNARNGGVPNESWTSIKSLGNGFYLCKCEGISQDGSNNLVGIYVRIGYKVYFSECYLENNREICSDPFFEDSVVYDCSGFNNNGTKTGTFVLTSDTSRYTTSLVFNGSDNSVQTPNLATLVPDGNFTISLWFKKFTDDWSSKGYETLYGGPSGFEIESKVSTTNAPVFKAYSWGGGSYEYTLDEWHHVVVTRNSSETVWYVDGESRFTGVAGSIPSGDYFVGAWKTSTGQNFKGYMSDFRIYATVLTADDIQDLYKVGMSIDKSQNLYAYNLDENYISNIEKTGVLNIKDEIAEYESVGLYKTGLVTANHFNEF